MLYELRNEIEHKILLAYRKGRDQEYIDGLYRELERVEFRIIEWEGSYNEEIQDGSYDGFETA